MRVCDGLCENLISLELDLAHDQHEFTAWVLSVSIFIILDFFKSTLILQKLTVAFLGYICSNA